MKTLTELSGSLIRTAAAAIAEARRSLPKEETPAPSPAQEPAAPPAAAQETAAPDAPVAAEAPATEPQAAPAPEAAAAKPAAPKREEEESEAVKAALDEAVAKATGLSGDRLSFLRGAVKAAGRRTADVRLVRVFGPEEPVSGAATVGGHQYVVDFLPSNMKQVPVPQKDDRGGRRGGRGGGGGGGRGGGKGAGPAGAGGFSMDSLRDDRKNNRGGSGRPGGGRPGGGRPPGGGAGRGGPGGNRGR